MTQASVVPAEFRGLARQFWRDAEREEKLLEPLVKNMFEPILNRIDRHPGRNLRDGTLKALALKWEGMPHDFRVAFRARVDARGRRGDIVEVRLSANAGRMREWESNGREESLELHSLEVAFPRKDRDPSQLLATVGLHALARRYQRCADHSQHAILDDFRYLVRANINDAKKYPHDNECQIETPRGTWKGIVGGVSCGGQPSKAASFIIRTFISW